MNQRVGQKHKRLTRREAFPLLGSLVAAPTILTGCSSPTESEPLWVPGTIAFERRPSYSSDETQRDIYIMDWSAETQINLTADIPGSQGRPFWSPDGTALYFDSIVDGNSFIQRISDLTNPTGSLETIVDEEGHQSGPIVHSDGNLLVYCQTDSLHELISGTMVAYDIDSGQEISRSGVTVVRVLGNNVSNNREFMPGQRKMMCTGVPSVGVFDPDTGSVEAYEFDSIPYSDYTKMYSVSHTQDGLFAYALATVGNFVDTLCSWNTAPGSRNVDMLDLKNIHGPRTRQMSEIIALPKQNIMLFSCRPGYVASTDPWKIGLTQLGTPPHTAGERFTTVAFDNMTGSNYWPRHTFTEHIHSD